MNDRVTVAGAGSWGTTLAALLAQNGQSVCLHCYPANIADGITRTRHNPLYFPDIKLPESIHATADLSEALADGPTVYLVVPTRYVREFISREIDTWREWAHPGAVLCNCTKGLLLDPTQRTDAWLTELFPDVDLVHLAGPNFAVELIAGKPAAAVVAGPEYAARLVQSQLMNDIYRIYTGVDTVGVEVAGFYKNIIAIAAGAVHELKLGDNARATLITRGLVEMGRLVAYFGGDPATLSGLAGVGDLVLTCGSSKSRNFQVGVRRARGQGLEQILDEMTQVAEGIQASRAVHLWPDEHPTPDSRLPAPGLEWPDLPIAVEVYRLMHENADAYEAVLRLMRRPPKAE